MSERITENTRSGVKSALWGWLVWYATPGSGFLFTVLNRDITQTLSPGNIEAFIIGTAAALGITGGVGAYYRDKRSPAPNVAPQTPISPPFAGAGATPSTAVAPEAEINQPAARTAQSETQQQRGAAVASDPYDKPLSVDVQKNWFSDSELECRGMSCDCEYPGMQPAVMAMANDLRNHFGPLIVSSAYRCPIHNSDVGGSPSSYHVRAQALDLRSPKHSPKELYDYLDAKYPKQHGVGLYDRFIHVDSRTSAWARKTGPDKPWRQFEHADADIQLA